MRASWEEFKCLEEENSCDLWYPPADTSGGKTHTNLHLRVECGELEQTRNTAAYEVKIRLLPKNMRHYRRLCYIFNHYWSNSKSMTWQETEVLIYIFYFHFVISREENMFWVCRIVVCKKQNTQKLQSYFNVVPFWMYGSPSAFYLVSPTREWGSLWF